MTSFITEEDVENFTLEILSELGYQTIYGPDIALDGINPERKDYSEVILIERLRDAIDRLNPDIPLDAKEEALKKVLRTESPELVVNNHAFHKMLVNGVDIEYRKDDRIIGNKVWLFDFKNPGSNEFLAVNCQRRLTFPHLWRNNFPQCLYTFLKPSLQFLTSMSG